MRVSNQCDSCTAPATLAICNRCTEELRAQLHALAHGPKINGHTTAGLLDACEDVVLWPLTFGPWASAWSWARSSVWQRAHRNRAAGAVQEAHWLLVLIGILLREL